MKKKPLAHFLLLLLNIEILETFLKTDAVDTDLNLFGNDSAWLHVPTLEKLS